VELFVIQILRNGIPTKNPKNFDYSIGIGINKLETGNPFDFVKYVIRSIFGNKPKLETPNIKNIFYFYIYYGITVCIT
jgi:hypothetical protein